MSMTECAMNASSLSDLCIGKLRTILRHPLEAKLARLPLPPFVRRCVMLEHVLVEFEE